MNLRTLQEKMAAAVMQPLTPSDRMRSKHADGRSMRKVASEFIKPNDRLTSFERLEIYNRQYWFRILSALADDFPGLLAVLGERKFDALSRAYLVECPSQSFTLRDLGSQLETWLQANPRWSAPHHTLALDAVRLEWAQIETFDAASLPVMLAEDLQNLDPDPRLVLQPFLRFLEVSYPVDDLLIALKEHEEAAGSMASNAMNERRKHQRVRKFRALKPQTLFLAVHRLEGSVYLKRLEPEAYRFLQALHAGKKFSRAALLAFQQSEVPEEQRPGMLQKWFHDWSSFGWFARPKAAKIS